MTFKSLFFGLLLYVALAWVGAAYWYTGEEIVQHGLLWTAIGIIAVLAFLIASWLFGWWRLRRARAAAKPPASAPAAAPVHPDDQAMMALLAEANTVLARAPSLEEKRRGTPLSAFPLYLLVGPEGSGKTTVFLNAGLEPQLLAGQGTTPTAPTRLANLWLARRAVFAEIGGKVFAGDPARWSQLLRLLRGHSTVGFWRRLLGEPDQPVELQGVIAFCDSKELTGASSDPQRLERSIRDWQERLRAIAEVFGAEFPVYFAVTKCDQISFFPDFFRRLPESEANQTLGCTLPAGDKEGSAEMLRGAAAKRLTDSFRELYHALAQRRLTYLAHEPNLAQRPGIYEFPRELKRIRTPLVQFLTDVFRPNPLGPGPVLRGYYLTGLRETEAAVTDSSATGGPEDLEATRLLRGDATSIFRQEATAKTPGGQGRFGLRWLFIADLFQRVVLPDRLARQVRPIEDNLERYRRLAFGAVGAVCVLLCGCFAWSWVDNRRLLSDVRTALSARIERRSLGDLQSLDRLQSEIRRLEDHFPWSYHWGLYSGDRILPEVRAAYFTRFQRVLLADLDGLMISKLDFLPATPAADASYDSVSRILKTHLTVTSGSCTLDSVLVAQVLKEHRARLAPEAGTDSRAFADLSDRQIDFYAGELAYGNPARLPEDKEASERGRQYLAKVNGIDRLYASILASVEKQAPKVSRLGDMAPNYKQVLSGPEQAPAAFSKDGWSSFEEAAKKSNPGMLGEPCLSGGVSAAVGDAWKNLGTAPALQRRFIGEYIEAWRNFVAGFSVLKYNSATDAAHKLELLADHKSPLLAVLALTANQTNFPAVGESATSTHVVQKFSDQALGILKKGESKAKAAIGATEEKESEPSRPADIARFFQPVHWVVPPGSDPWVVPDKNAAYIDALSQLGGSMQAIADGENNADPAVYQQASQNYDKAMETVRQIVKGFKVAGVGGLDTSVQALLEAPIRLTTDSIRLPDRGKGVNAALRTFCISQQNTLRKYPFLVSSSGDVGLDQLAAFLQPGSGALWKFQQQSLADFAVKDGSQWKPKDPAKNPQVTPEMLAYLNRAQAAADAFYPGGATQPQLTYTLRPKLDPSKDTILELEIDGRSNSWTTPLQKQFTWPAPPGTKDLGAIARLRTSSTAFPFASEGGTWGIFKILGDAEPRDLGSKVVEWKYSRGRLGRAEEIKPPVQLEIVTFPGGVDVFNPQFWAGLQKCPSTAVQ